MLPADITLTSVAEPDDAVLRALAETIWRRHYAAIIPAAQIEFMLAARFAPEAVRRQVQAADRWLELLRVSGVPVGYCGYELAATDGNEQKADAMKLGQLYVLESHRGAGLGRFMLGRVAGRARDLGRRVLWLQVNKRNTEAIGFYRAMGFDVVREAVFDIGSGFVMDDYVMSKTLAA